jgi:hypothetical protein
MSLGNDVVQLNPCNFEIQAVPFSCNGVSAVKPAQPIAQYLCELLRNRVPHAFV